MQTDFVLLSQLLQQVDPALRYHPNNPRIGAISQIRAIAAVPNMWDPETLYLINSSCLPDSFPFHVTANLLCILDSATPKQIARDASLNVIYTTTEFTESSVNETLSQVRKIQQKFFTAVSEITDALYFGKGLQAIVDIGAKLIGNPMFILDTGFKALAVSKSVPVRNAVIRRDAERGYLNENALEYMKKKAWFDSLQSNGSLLYFPISDYQEYVGEEELYEFCYCYVKVNGVVAAYINILGENTPLLEYHKAWISKLAQFTAIELQKDPRFLNGRGAMYEALLTDLLSNRITDQLVAIRRLRLLDRELKRHLRVVTVRKAHTEKSSFTAIEQDRIRDFFPDSISVAFMGDIALLVSSDDEILHTKAGEKMTNRTFTLNGLIAGVSNAFENVTDMYRYYVQATKALEFGTHIFSSGKLFYYSDYTVFHALDLCTERVDLRDFCHPGVLKLRESNNPGDRELYQALYLYLLYMRDVNRVAAEMHVHKGTLYYRLKKLQAELGFDLDNGNDVFQLMFSYKLEEYMDIFEPSNSPLPPQACASRGRQSNHRRQLKRTLANKWKGTDSLKKESVPLFIMTT